MRAKKITTERSLNESDVTTPAGESRNHNSIPALPFLKLMGYALAAAILYSIFH